MTLQEHLVNGAVDQPWRNPSPWSALKALRAWEVAAGASGDSAFSVAFVREITLHPFNEPLLNPRVWKVGRPGLSLQSSLAGVALKVWAFHRPLPRPGTRHEWDLGRLSSIAESVDGQPPPALVLDLDLGHLIADGPHSALQRAAVFALYEYRLIQLSRFFHCTVDAALVCFGAQNVLDVRRYGGADEGVPADVSGLAAVPWHPGLSALCESESLTPVEALRIFQQTKMLPEDKKADAWLNALGKLTKGGKRAQPPVKASMARRGYAALAQILAILELEDQPKTHPPLTDENAKKAVATLNQLLQEHGDAGYLAALQARYLLTEDDAWSITRKFLPQLFLKLPRPLPVLVEGLKAFQANNSLDSALADEYRRQLFAHVRGLYKAVSGDWPTRVKRAMDGVAESRAELDPWARQAVPELVVWLDELADAYVHAGKSDPLF